MFGLGVTELVVILVVALLFFGPGRLPEIGGALGKGIRDFKKGLEHKGDEPQAQVAAKSDGDPPA